MVWFVQKKTGINSQLILVIDYVLILVVGAPTRDYKEFDGHLENTLNERSEIEFLKSSNVELPEWDQVIFLQWGSIEIQREFKI